MTDPKPTELRVIPGHPGYYAGSDGCIWSWKTTTLRKLVATEGRDHYLAVCLYNAGKRKRKRVHSLVCRAFHGDRVTTLDCGKRYLVVRHLDGNRQNNAPGNLQWGTYAENYQDMMMHRAELEQVPPGWKPGDPDKFDLAQLEATNDIPF